MKMRPVFSTVLEPLAPMNDMNCSTYGCCLTMSATARWCAIIESNDTSCAVSVNANTVPLSSFGMNPFGMMTKR